MKLKVINSNSSGNCYILHNEHEALIIECGVKFSRIKQGLGFNLAKVSGCIVTHEHKDHSVAIADLLNSGIQVWASTGTHKACNTDLNNYSRFTFSGDQFKVGSFKVVSFETKHDAAEPLGFLINHEETGNILFLTDTFYSEYKFKNLHNIIIEANYSRRILDEKLKNGFIIPFLMRRIIKSHMNIETTVNLLKANDLSKVNNIVLIHLSDSNSDADLFENMVSETTAKSVFVASAGMEIEFNKTPF